MLLKLPCRFGEVFEQEESGRKKEYMLAGFSQGLGVSAEIDVTEFPVGAHCILSELYTLPA